MRRILANLLISTDHRVQPRPELGNASSLDLSPVVPLFSEALDATDDSQVAGVVKSLKKIVGSKSFLTALESGGAKERLIALATKSVEFPQAGKAAADFCDKAKCTTTDPAVVSLSFGLIRDAGIDKKEAANAALEIAATSIVAAAKGENGAQGVDDGKLKSFVESLTNSLPSSSPGVSNLNSESGDAATEKKQLVASLSGIVGNCQLGGPSRGRRNWPCQLLYNVGSFQQYFEHSRQA